MGRQHPKKASWLLGTLLSWTTAAGAQAAATDAPATSAGQPRTETAATGVASPAPTPSGTQPTESAAASPTATAGPALPIQPAPVTVADGPNPPAPRTDPEPVGGSEEAAPRELPYYEEEPAPQGYRLVERPRRGLVIAGALTLGVPYAISVSVAAGGNYNRTSGWLLIPVIGPWITTAKIPDHDCNDTPGSCDGSAQGERGMAAFDGIAQAAGAAMLIVGLTVPKRLWIRETTAELSIVPTRIGREGYGLVGVGRF
jgi:hypothetical protein